jgi:hypothetical protein
MQLLMAARHAAPRAARNGLELRATEKKKGANTPLFV